MAIKTVGEVKLCPCCHRFVESKQDLILPHNTILIGKDCVTSKLEKILNTMDVPEKRIKDLDWLNRNLFFKNIDHLDFDLAIWCIKTLLKLKAMSNETH